MRYILLIISILCWCIQPANAQNFVNAKYGGDFLSVGAGARALGMGSAGVALSDDVTAAYWNPAGLTAVKDIQVAYMHSERFTGIVSYDYGAIAYPLKEDSGVLAISVFRQAVDNIKNTLNAWDEERNLPREDAESYFEEFSVADLAFYVTYARQISKNLSWGTSAKLINHRLGLFADAWGYSIDAGLKYNFGGAAVGIHIMDITTMMKFWQVNRDAFGDFEETFDDEIPSGQNERVLPTVKIGASQKFLLNDFKISAGADLDIRFENRRAYHFNLGRMSFEPHIGVEGTYLNRISLRVGLTDFSTDPSNKIDFSPTIGAGLNFNALTIDYGFANFAGASEVLGQTHRISLKVTI